MHIIKIFLLLLYVKAYKNEHNSALCKKKKKKIETNARRVCRKSRGFFM